MLPLIAFSLGLALGAGALFAFLVDRQHKLREQKRKQDETEREIESALTDLKERQAQLAEDRKIFESHSREIQARYVSYEELLRENALLKRDLQGIDVDLRKAQLDRQVQREKQAVLAERVEEIGQRYLKENVKWIGSSLTANNYAASKQRLQTIIQRCREINFRITAAEETELLEDLKREFQKAVRAALEREEQARIKAQIREEQQREREIERELNRLEREKAAIQAALEKARAEAREEFGEEIQNLKARLTEAEEKTQRVISQAQLTRAGHVYVISNIGSFGEGVFKIGMTRRLEPYERVRELGDASVPFPFDVHMMISSNDAPKLEAALHRALYKKQLNKVNPRKEFFRAEFDLIRVLVQEHHGEVDYIADAEALEYRQTVSMTEDDAEFIEDIYESADEDDAVLSDDI